jgi:hypothetical protein
MGGSAAELVIILVQKGQVQISAGTNTLVGGFTLFIFKCDRPIIYTCVMVPELV